MRQHGSDRSARAIVVFLIVSAFALGSASTASAAMPACGDTITTNVVFTSNLACAGGTALFVLADNVTINFEGYSLMGSGSGRGLFIGGAGVTIKNGTIRGFGTGADPEAGFGQVRTTFSKMTITGNGDGISGCDVGLLTVQSTSVVGNGGWGINQGCSGAVFVTAGSRVLRNNAGGIAGGGASGGVSVDDSFVSENGGYGIYEVNQGVRLTNSFFSGNPILDFSTYGDLFTVKGNKFRNSPLIPLDTVSIVDLGGNLCAVGTAPFLPCVFP